MSSHHVDVVVVGGGIAGLATAYQLSRIGTGLSVVLLEGDHALGGKIQSSRIAGGHAIDVGPDAFLSSAFVIQRLCDELNLSESLVTPINGTTGILVDNSVRPIPPGLISGVPVSLISLARMGMLSWRGTARASCDLLLPRRRYAQEPTVAEIVASRVGEEVLTRLVDPLVGGVYAGDTRYLSARYATPQLFNAVRDKRSLLLGLRVQPRVQVRAGLQTFQEGGLRRLVDSLSMAMRKTVRVETGSRARVLGRIDGRWEVGTDTDIWSAQHVVLALPTHEAARLLHPSEHHLAETLSQTEYAAVITVTLAFAQGKVTERKIPGFIVPRSEGHLIMVLTCISDRWTHHKLDNTLLVRCSVGRHGEDGASSFDDDELIRRVSDEVRTILQIIGVCTDAVVKRWPQAIPQYGRKHGEVLSRIGDAEKSRLYFAGAAYGGVGVASCIEQGIAVAERIYGKYQLSSYPSTGGTA